MGSSRRVVVAFAAALAALLSACAKNPLGPSPAAGAPLNNGSAYLGIVEAPGANVLFSPNSVGETTTKWGGPIKYSWGGASKVFIPGSGLMDAGTAPFDCGDSAQSTAVDIVGPGIGGPDGSFGSTDYYIRFRGVKGSSAACDYNSLYIALKAGTYVEVDLTQYRGMIFFAKGKGKWAVQIEGHGVKTGQPGPYTDFNYYERIFGDELSETAWKQITVLWSEIKQEYGQAVDKDAALRKSTALQFIQEAPYVTDFELQLDYIRFF